LNRNKKFDRGNKSDSSKLSTSLRNLEKRKLVVRFPQPKQGNSQRTSHVKLTDDGRNAGIQYRNDPRSWKDKRLEISQWRKRAALDRKTMEEEM
jgi:DNA-binding MarR family transcriptional regulator